MKKILAILMACRFYLVTDGEKVLCLTAAFTAEAVAVFGERFEHIAKSVMFDCEAMIGE